MRIEGEGKKSKGKNQKAKGENGKQLRLETCGLEPETRNPKLETS